ncbi:methylated-DNA--[protein]-cysteine S-methyltransferase [Anoxybacterium hadale]|uniref:Methylated-DNA--[protein]-cysteine S-methyltransferase n=1 Tax=Anoxybacterium hadale TaxID=3408580 RepID=A0ACD1AAZ2_9FIRM|nr:methylated-DNA--[protein]-cysteine S-methyltransferase [Clostridiales bacterium]
MTDQEKWEALTNNSANTDGMFVYAVKSTGIFCRPSCKSKTPLRKNIVFFPSSEAAAAAGFRPCKRCRPDLLEYEPVKEVGLMAKNIIEQFFCEKEKLYDELLCLGVSEHRMTQIFKVQYGMTPTEYRNLLRRKAAEEKLKKTTLPVIEIAFSLGFESLSAFFSFFRKSTGMTPKAYREEAIEKTKESEDRSYGLYKTSIGEITIAASNSSIIKILYGNHIPPHTEENKTGLTDQAASEIKEYLTGKRIVFDVPLEPHGTLFQKKVWEALMRIPYGETRSYKQIAEEIGNPGSSRAVGMANNKNPILIMIPCHRVIGSDGSLVGYAGGIPLKEKLLRLEQNR